MSIVKAKTSKKIRKAHRYLGLFLGIQFLFWTISGLYFSWTDLDEIHGDHFKKVKEQVSFTNLININELEFDDRIKTFELREIADLPTPPLAENIPIRFFTFLRVSGILNFSFVFCISFKGSFQVGYN